MDGVAELRSLQDVPDRGAFVKKRTACLARDQSLIIARAGSGRARMRWPILSRSIVTVDRLLVLRRPGRFWRPCGVFRPAIFSSSLSGASGDGSGFFEHDHVDACASGD